MDHIAGGRLLHFGIADTQRLPEVFHRVAVELLGHDPRSHGRKSVVAFPDEPIGSQRVSPGRPAPTIGDIERDHIAKNVILSVVGGHVFRGAADHRAELDLPVGAIPAVRDHDGIAVADDRALAGLQKQIRDAPILTPLPSRLRALLLGARLVDVAIEVDRGVEYLSGVHDGRERS